MFPSISDLLFYSGFAGLVINCPALALTTVFLYRILLATGNCDPRLAIAVALIYPLNPNILYLAVTAMTEVTFMLFLVASAFYLQKWIRFHKSSSILACSALVAAATLCRYEAWPLTIFVLSFALIALIKKRLRWTKALAAAALSIFGILLWLGWNMYSFGNPLDFATAEYYSPASAATDRPVRGTLFLQPLNVLGIYGITAAVVFGPILLWAGARGFIAQFRKQFLWYLALPAVFTPLSMLGGIGEMSIWFNSRFIVFLAPVLMISSFKYLQGLTSKVRFATVMLIFVHILLVIPFMHSFTYFDNISKSGLMPIPLSLNIGVSNFNLDQQGIVTVNEPSRYEFRYQILNDVPLIGVVTLIDSLFSFNYPDNLSAIKTGEFLKSNYDNGRIMTMAGSGQGQMIMITSWINFSQYDEMTETGMTKESFNEPWAYDKWLVIAKNPEWNALKVYQYWRENRTLLDQRYEPVFENEHYQILKLKAERLSD